MATGRLLTVTSLLSLIFLTLHVSDDIARGISSLNFASMIAVLVVAMLLYATLTGEGRRAGAVSGFLIGLFALGMPALHFRGARCGAPTIARGPLAAVPALARRGRRFALPRALAARRVGAAARRGSAAACARRTRVLTCGVPESTSGRTHGRRTRLANGSDRMGGTQPKVGSGRLVLTRWLPLLAYVALVFILSAQPNLSVPGTFRYRDKVAHLIEYGGLAWLVQRAARDTWPGAG